MKRIIALILLLATAMLTTSCYKYDAVSDFGSSGNGSNKVDVDGGVGAINIVFKDN